MPVPTTGVMGILNVTPDSFSDGGRFLEGGAAIEHGRALRAAGADLVDVGGESTRPGAAPVGPDEELRRVLPVVEALAPEMPVSIDTTKAAVAAEALTAGAVIVNDVSAGRFDEEMLPVVAEQKAGFVAMHMQGEPTTMQDDPRYDDVVGEVATFLTERVAAARAAGVSRDRVLVDPGFGFGKTRDHNLELLARLDEVVERVGQPVVVGTSRKSFVAAFVGDGVAARDDGTLGTVVWARMRGAAVVRVHDVRPARHAFDLLDALDVADARSAV